jgi:hypothetical protein
VFTYWLARRVGLYSPNEDAIFDVMGGKALGEFDSVGAALCGIAFWAMRADVGAELVELRQAEAEKASEEVES